MNIPQYLTKQALSPTAHASVETPTVVRYRPINQQDVVEWEVSHAAVAQLLMYKSCGHYFRRQKIRRYAAEWFEFQPTLTPPKATISRWVSEITAAGIAANKARFAAELKAREDAEVYRRTMRESIIDSRRYHLKALDQRSLVSCPVTGICFEVQMPSIPVFVQQTHPYASLPNVFAALEWFFVTSEVPNRLQELDTPVLAGMLLVLLRAKHRLSEEETSALAQNAALQFIPKGTLAYYIKTLHSGWEMNKVWSAMPSLRLCAEGQNVLATLNDWFKRATLHLAGKPTNEANVQAKLFEATRYKAGSLLRVKIYSADTTQHRQVQDKKESAHTLYKELAPKMPQLLKTLVRSTISELLLITADQKVTVTAAIAKAFVGTPQQSKAESLIALLNSVETGSIAKELSRVSDDFAAPKRSISEILASKLHKQNEGN